MVNELRAKHLAGGRSTILKRSLIAWLNPANLSGVGSSGGLS